MQSDIVKLHSSAKTVYEQLKKLGEATVFQISESMDWRSDSVRSNITTLARLGMVYRSGGYGKSGFIYKAEDKPYEVINPGGRPPMIGGGREVEPIATVKLDPTHRKFLLANQQRWGKRGELAREAKMSRYELNVALEILKQEQSVSKEPKKRRRRA
ncbi:hypothetical protein WMW72_12285 [Paenibacillus filicis]|uniref:Uncharacterized protein n=1 Tax=Paenibacillus filicis TaxID=669464 RepID=A0ABU9DIS4_9BACL